MSASASDKRSMNLEEEALSKKLKATMIVGEDDKHASSANDFDDSKQAVWRLLVNVKFVGGIIGRQGSNIEQMRRETGASIQISPPMPQVTERVVTLSGPTRSICKAANSIALSTVTLRTEQPEASASSPSTVTITMLVSNSQIGAIIGKGGRTIKSIQEQSHATVKISYSTMPNSTDRSVSIHGSPHALEQALFQIAAKLQQNPISDQFRESPYTPSPPLENSLQYSYPTVSGLQAPFAAPTYHQQHQNMNTLTQHISVPNNLVGSVIGKKGLVISQIRALSGCQVKIAATNSSDPQLDSPVGERVITIIGEPHANEIALGLIHGQITSAIQQQNNSSL